MVKSNQKKLTAAKSGKNAKHSQKWAKTARSRHKSGQKRPSVRNSMQNTANSGQKCLKMYCMVGVCASFLFADPPHPWPTVWPTRADQGPGPTPPPLSPLISYPAPIWLTLSHLGSCHVDLCILNGLATTSQEGEESPGWAHRPRRPPAPPRER